MGVSEGFRSGEYVLKLHYVDKSVSKKLCHISAIPSYILLILFMNCTYNLLILYKRKLNRHRNIMFSLINKNNEQ